MNVEIYPMPAFPTLELQNLVAVAEWYQEVLGFQHVFSLPGPDGSPRLIHLRWAKYADLLLRPESVASSEQKGIGITLTFAVTSADAVDSIAEKARAHGARTLSEPQNQPWNARDFSVADPEGFRLIFTYGPLNPDLSMDQLVNRIGGAKP